MNQTKLYEKSDQDAQDFDAKYPIGTRVRYWKGVRSGDPEGESVTRSNAGVIGQSACVLIEGVRGAVALTHVEVVE